MISWFLYKTHKDSISQVLRFGDLSDEITGIPVICEYTLQSVDICSFCRPRFLPASLSLSPVQCHSLFVDISQRHSGPVISYPIWRQQFPGGQIVEALYLVI
jgi:hypothetical protein